MKQLLLCGFVLVLTACTSFSPLQVAVHEGSSRNGQALYKMCTSCHEEKVRNWYAPPLVGNSIIWNDAGFMQTVWYGRSAQYMPAWRWALTPQDIKDIQTYLQERTDEEIVKGEVK